MPWDRLRPVRSPVFRVVVAAVLLAPAGAATASGELELLSSPDVFLDGTIDVVAPGASAIGHLAPDPGAIEIRGATGWVEITTWTSADACPMGCVLRQPATKPSSQSVKVTNATIRFDDLRDGFRYRVVAREDGILHLRGPIRAEAFPRLLGRPYTSDGPPAPADLSPPKVVVAWDADWTFLGEHTVEGMMERGSPNVPGGVLDASGPVLFQAGDGRVSFIAADGRRVSATLGNRTEQIIHAPGGPAIARTEQWTRLIFNGTLASSNIPLTTEWGLAGPAVTWQIEGLARWRNATGEAQVAGRTFQLRDAVVEAVGSFVIAPASSISDISAVAPVLYVASGDFDSLTINGRAVSGAQGSDDIGAVSAIAILLTLLAAAARYGVSLYSRISTGDALTHPTRQRIWDLVRGEPGVVQQDAFRRVGGAWGPFHFHLRVLVRAGLVHVDRLDRYRVLRPTSGALPERPGEPVLPHPVTRAVWRALPPDGALLGNIGQDLGLSRQLARYHIARLESRGLVRVERAEDHQLLVIPTALERAAP